LLSPDYRRFDVSSHQPGTYQRHDQPGIEAVGYAGQRRALARPFTATGEALELMMAI
jgi:hypothetical protein